MTPHKSQNSLKAALKNSVVKIAFSLPILITFHENTSKSWKLTELITKLIGDRLLRLSI